MRVSDRIIIKIATFYFSFQFNNIIKRKIIFSLKKFYNNYLITSKKPYLIINFHLYKNIKIPPLSSVIYTMRTWDLYKKGNVIFLHFHLNKKSSDSFCKINLSSKSINFYIQKGFLPHSLFYLFPKILCSIFLPFKDAFMFHSCGVVFKNKGYLFLGSSGDGKSTLASIAEKSGLTVLNDDVVIITKEKNNYRIYSTPWGCSFNLNEKNNKGYIIYEIFLLKKANKNKILPVPKNNIYKEILGNLFLINIDKRIIQKIYNLICDLCEDINFYYLLFNLDLNLKEVLNEFSK